MEAKTSYSTLDSLSSKNEPLYTYLDENCKNKLLNCLLCIQRLHSQCDSNNIIPYDESDFVIKKPPMHIHHALFKKNVKKMVSKRHQHLRSCLNEWENELIRLSENIDLKNLLGIIQSCVTENMVKMGVEDIESKVSITETLTKEVLEQNRYCQKKIGERIKMKLLKAKRSVSGIYCQCGCLAISNISKKRHPKEEKKPVSISELNKLIISCNRLTKSINKLLPTLKGSARKFKKK